LSTEIEIVIINALLMPIETSMDIDYFIFIAQSSLHV
jgi:hypothetical protein